MNWMLARLRRATRDQAAAAALGSLPTTRALYIDCLKRIYGFEAPIESAFAMTAGLAETVDLRSRRRTRLLKADLCGLGVANTAELELLSMQPFHSTCEALGWMYVVDRSALMHGMLQRHVAQLPNEVANATSYLSNGGRGVESRLEDLGVALDQVVQTPEAADQIIEAARCAFDVALSWFAHDSVIDRGTSTAAR